MMFDVVSTGFYAVIICNNDICTHLNLQVDGHSDTANPLLRHRAAGGFVSNGRNYDLSSERATCCTNMYYNFDV